MLCTRERLPPLEAHERKKRGSDQLGPKVLCRWGRHTFLSSRCWDTEPLPVTRLAGDLKVAPTQLWGIMSHIMTLLPPPLLSKFYKQELEGERAEETGLLLGLICACSGFRESNNPSKPNQVKHVAEYAAINVYDTCSKVVSICFPTSFKWE